MRTKEFIYNQKVVEFLIADDVMVNATEMGKIFNQKPAMFLRLESTKKWISWLENNAIRQNRVADSAPLDKGNDDLIGEIRHRSADLVPILIVGRGGGDTASTWMHRLLAIDFAMWLDLSFKGWIIQHIDGLLFDYSLGKLSINVERKKLKNRLTQVFRDNANDPKITEIEKILNRQQKLKGDEFNLNIQFKRKFNED
jgi:hypothetical protein